MPEGPDGPEGFSSPRSSTTTCYYSLLCSVMDDIQLGASSPRRASLIASPSPPATNQVAADEPDPDDALCEPDPHPHHALAPPVNPPRPPFAGWHKLLNKTPKPLQSVCCSLCASRFVDGPALWSSALMSAHVCWVLCKAYVPTRCCSYGVYALQPFLSALKCFHTLEIEWLLTV